MTAVTTTPPALRWVALFLAACAGLGLFLGFRDQIRKDPPDWYTGQAQVALPAALPDAAREAVAIEGEIQPATAEAPPPPKARSVPASPPVEEKAAEEKAAPPTKAPEPAPPRPRPAPPPEPVIPPSTDPVGDLLESQKAPDPQPPTPY